MNLNTFFVWSPFVELTLIRCVIERAALLGPEVPAFSSRAFFHVAGIVPPSRSHTSPGWITEQEKSIFVNQQSNNQVKSADEKDKYVSVVDFSAVFDKICKLTFHRDRRDFVP